MIKLKNRSRHAQALREIVQDFPDARGLIVFRPIVDWNIPLFQRPQQLAKAFAKKGFLVFYCSPNWKYDDYDSGFTAISDYLYIYHGDHKVFNLLDDYLVFLNWNIDGALKPFKKAKMIYDYIDRIDLLSVYSARVQADHIALIRDADVVSVTADDLFKEVKEIRNDIILCPNAADVEHFRIEKPEIPEDIRSIVAEKKPIIGYYGSLARWFDYELLKYAAAQRPGYNFLIVGYDYDGSIYKAGIDGFANILRTGPVHYSTLQNYLYYFDVATIPFKVDKITAATSPVKLFEYAAAGKPIVTTAMKECMKYGEVLVGGTYEEFLANIDKALTMRNDETYLRKLEAFAESNSWDVRVAQFVNEFKRKGLINNMLPYKCAPDRCDVLVQVDNFLSGGLENVVLDLNLTMMEAGLRVSLLVLGEAGMAVDRAREIGVDVRLIRFTAPVYTGLLRDASPKVVLSHYSTQGTEICKQMNIPLIQVIHNTYMWFSEEQAADFAASARNTTAFVAVSDFAKAYSVQRLGVPAEKCLVIPNGIDLVKFKKLDFTAERKSLRMKYGLAEDDFVFLSVGAITYQKNHPGTIRAFHLAITACPKAKLVILGPLFDQQLFNDIQIYISRHKLDDRIIYAGASPNPHGYYAMADAFVSAAFFEGGPLSLLEALAANLPIIMAEVGLAAHFKGRKGIAIIPPPLDLFSYYGRMWELQSSPEFERELAMAMETTYRERIRPNFNEKMLDQMDKSKSYQLYLSLVKQISEGSEIQMWRLPNSWTNLLTTAE